MVLEQFIIDADIIWDQVGKIFFENPEAKPGRIMRVQVVNAGIIEDLTGYTLNLGWTSVRDSSKFGLDAFDAVDITKGIFEIEYTTGMLTNIGPLNSSLQLVPPGEGRPIESNNFKLTVKNSAINPAAIQGETSFKALENALVEVNGWNARIDVVEQEYKDRADALDEAYPVRLTAAEQSVAAVEAQVDLLNRGLGETMPTMASLLAAYPTGDTRDHIVAGNIAEVDTLTVTGIPTTAGNVTVTLNGVAKTVAVDPAVQTTTTLIATAIRAASYPGWITGGTGAVVTFTATTVGTRTAPVFSGGTTGTTGTFVRTAIGEAANFHRYFWNGTAWADGGVYQAIEVVNESLSLIKMNKDIQSFIGEESTVYTPFQNQGYYLRNGTISNDVGYSHEVIPVIRGEKFIITGHDFINLPLYVLFDSNGSVIQTYPTNSNPTRTLTENLELIIPSNGVSLIVNKTSSITLKTYSPIIKKLETRTKVGFEQLNESIKSALEYAFSPQELSMVTDYFYGSGGSLTAYVGVDSTSIAVSEGEKFLITGSAWSNVQFYTVLDISGVVISSVPNANIGSTINNYVDYELTIPPGGALLLLNDIRRTGSYTRLSVKRSTTFQPKGISAIDGRVSVIENAIEDATLDPLFGKTILFDGDSICHGGSANDGKSGWAGRIGTKHNMVWKNYGIGGGTVTSGTYSYTTVVDTGTLDWVANTYYKKNSSPTTADDMYLVVTQGAWNGTDTLYTKGSARHWESTTVDTMYAEYPNANYVIFEACLNDGFNNIPIGSVSSSYTGTFATNQYAPAFEYMIKRARELFGNAKIGVIIPHRVASSTIPNYHVVARQICEKWGIDYLDLERKSGLTPHIEPMKSTMYSDGSTHLTTSGYDYITYPKVEDWLKSL